MKITLIGHILTVIPENEADNIFLMLCRIHLPFTVKYDSGYHDEESNIFGTYHYILKLYGDNQCK